MMAFDPRSTPEPRTISDSTRALLGQAVLGVWNDPARWPRGDLTESPDSSASVDLARALERLVGDAREHSLRAEEVIVAFKDLLGTLPALNAPERRLEATHFRERLITECIRAYYTR